MDEPVVSEVDAHVGDVIGGVVRLGEEDQVTPLQVVGIGYDAAVPGLLL